MAPVAQYLRRSPATGQERGRRGPTAAFSGLTGAIAARCGALLAGLLLAAGPAFAHGVGSSQIHLRVDGPRIEGRWDLHLHDARLAIGLDPARAGDAGWTDLHSHADSLRAVLARHLTIVADSGACTVTIADTPLEWIPDQEVVRARVVSACPAAPTRLTIGCDLLLDLVPSHRNYFSVEDARAISVGVFRTDQRSVTIDIRQFHFVSIAAEFVREGVWHIWAGLDHLLFLVALLLPAPLLRAGRDWQPRGALGPTAREVVKVVTAFTVAHSLTLCLSFFGLLVPPSNLVEGGIALSVFVAAWNNLHPFLPGRVWVMALGFGLVHGLGFAGVLKNLSLPRHAQGLALGAFNVGVELGQLALVAALLPLLHVGSRRGWYPRLVLGAGSLGIAWLAAIWTLERGFGLAIFPRR